LAVLQNKSVSGIDCGVRLSCTMCDRAACLRYMREVGLTGMLKSRSDKGGWTKRFSSNTEICRERVGQRLDRRRCRSIQMLRVSVGVGRPDTQSSPLKRLQGSSSGRQDAMRRGTRRTGVVRREARGVVLRPREHVELDPTIVRVLSVRVVANKAWV
jgi:hypothetical protein